MDRIDGAIAAAALWIELGGSLIIGFGVCRAVAVLLRSGRRTGSARLIVADAVIAGLNFKLAATLLKAAELRSWNQIATFAAILGLRTLLKYVIERERDRAGGAYGRGRAAGGGLG